jgi:cytochrome P450
MELGRTLNLGSRAFAEHKYALYEGIREQRPVARARISVLPVWTVARHEDCVFVLRDPRFVRDRSTATGGSRLPLPLPPSVRPMLHSMITEDEPAHRRQRELVRRAFRPQAIAGLEERIEAFVLERLDALGRSGTVDLQADFALPVPMRMIAALLGVPEASLPGFRRLLDAVSRGFSGWRVLHTLFFRLPETVRFVRELVRAKRGVPGDDVLTALVHAEADGDRLSEDELVAMVLLLVIAGFETTVHGITNGVVALLDHPEQLERLRADPSLWDPAVEEILRHRGPVQSTKPNYACEDVTLHGVTIPRGAAVMPLLGAANHDPRVHHDPQRFDVGRSPNHHLAFGHGIHYCLGAHLARAEMRIALRRLFERFPDLALAVPRERLRLQAIPGWHRHDGLPVRIGVRRAAA